jgi:hypothetical protein
MLYKEDATEQVVTLAWLGGYLTVKVNTGYGKLTSFFI